MTPVQAARSLALANALRQPLAEPFDLTSICRCAIGQCGEAVGFEFGEAARRQINTSRHLIDAPADIREFFGLNPDLFLYGGGHDSNVRTAQIYDLAPCDLMFVRPEEVAAKIEEAVAKACAGQDMARVPVEG